MSGLIKFSHRSINSGGYNGVAVLVIVLKYLTFLHNSTLSPVTLAAPLLTVFSAQFVVSFSTAWRC